MPSRRLTLEREARPRSPQLKMGFAGRLRFNEPRAAVPADDPCEAGVSGADPEYAGIYLHARYFDPKLGIFLSPDPIGVSGGMNLYAYVLGNPVNGTDRSGLDGTLAPCPGADPKDPSPPLCYTDDSNWQDNVSIWHRVPPAVPKDEYDPQEALNELIRNGMLLMDNTQRQAIIRRQKEQVRREMQADIDEQDRLTAETTAGNAVVPVVPPPIAPKPYDGRKARIQSVTTLAVGWALDKLADRMDCSRARAAVRGASAALEAAGAAEAGAVAIGTGIATVTTSETVVGAVIGGAGTVAFGALSYAGFRNAMAYLDAAGADWGCQ